MLNSRLAFLGARVRRLHLQSLQNARFSCPPQEEVTQSVITSGDPYKGQPMWPLLRAWGVMKISAIDAVVSNSERLLALSKRTLGTRFTAAIVKKTFFAHFCGGQTEAEVLPTIDSYSSKGIGVILDYAVESDIGPSPDETIESYMEAQCDQTLEQCLSCIDIASKRPDGFAAIKLTGLGNPELLMRIAFVTMHIRQTFEKMFDTTGDSVTDLAGKSAGVYTNFLTDSKYACQHSLNRAINFDEFCDGVKRLGMNLKPETKRKMFDSIDSSKDGRVDFLEWIEYVQPTNVVYRQFFVEAYDDDPFNEDGPRSLEQSLTREEVLQMDKLVSRLHRLANAAYTKRVRLLVDAEHSYFQPAIDHLVLHLQRQYNKEFPTVFNTYQCYLRDSYTRVCVDVERSRREDFFFAAKMVRGAYMVMERDRAEIQGEEDPIHYNKKRTDANFDRTISRVLKHANKTCIVVATHNEKSVDHTVSEMKYLGIPQTGVVYFAQLMGMADRISFGLAQNGYRVMKYVPFGPVMEVIPYLLRRAQENSSLMLGAIRERAMLTEEIRRRLFGL